MLRKYIVAVFLSLVGFSLVFQGGTYRALFDRVEASENATEVPAGVAPSDGAGDGAWDWRELGEATFLKQCAPCHGMAGEGMPGVFPALAGNEFVMGDAKTVIRVPMNGRGGMPRFRDTLSDEEFAAVLSHVRNSWGNEAEPILPELVAEVRKE